MCPLSIAMAMEYSFFGIGFEAQNNVDIERNDIEEQLYNGEMNRKNIVIEMGSVFVGLYLSICKLLYKDYNIIVVVSNSFSRKIVEDIVPDSYSSIELKDEFYINHEKNKINKIDTIKEALIREKKYGEMFSMILSTDRLLGKGYFFNADKHPDARKSWWSHEKKIGELLKAFLFWEYIVDEYRPVLILGKSIDKVLGLIARHNSTNYISLDNARYGYRKMWVENEYYQNNESIKRVKENVVKYTNMNTFSSITYVQEQSAKYFHGLISYNYYIALKTAILRFPSELIRLFTGYFKKNQGYRFLGWYPSMFRKPYIYNYFKKFGRKPEDLQGYSLVYFPLHMEPETSLSIYSPEFTNSMELITWVSKSLPAGTLIVVKEQPHSYGIRPKQYYDNLRRMGNVVLAHPDTTSWQWIKCSILVTTITGTAGFEAIYFDKPVLSAGKHQLINHLPTVRYINSFDSVKEAVKELLLLSENEKLFKVSKEALYHAQHDVSFEVKGIEKLVKSRKLHMDIAEIAVKTLKEKYNI